MQTTRRPLLRKGFGAELPDDSKVLSKIVAASKTSGTLNLSNRQLQEVPEEVFHLPANDDTVRWWEAVDLTKLDLSHNDISQLPEQLWQLDALVTLLLGNNKLQSVQPGISQLQSLRMLDLSDNPLGPVLPESLGSVPLLATLSVNNCGLEELPSGLGGPQQPKLTALNACGNRLRRLPDGLAAASSLVLLKASHNQLQELPGRLVHGWRALKELDLSNNQLQELPGELGSLPLLTALDVRNNQLGSLPPALGDAAQLMELRAGFNRLSSLPDDLGRLGNLKTLDLRNNVIEELPEGVCGLGLVLLDLTNNSLRCLPPALGHMTSLRSMPLTGNPLKLMRRELWAGPLSALLQHLRDQETLGSMPPHPVVGAASSTGMPGMDVQPEGGVVSLRGRGLSAVPAGVWQASDSVVTLDVSDNNLSGDTANINAGLPQLVMLRVLAMNNCALEAWPLAGLRPSCLQALHSLELRGNRFGCVPVDSLVACPQLRSLELTGVRSLQLPEGMFDHTPHLEVLVASRAGLAEFPAALLSCTSLKQVNLSSNSISSVPVQVTQLTRLEELDLQNNQLSNLPPQVGLMAPRLRVLLLEGNCIRVIRRPVLEKGTTAVLEWLRDRIPVT